MEYAPANLERTVITYRAFGMNIESDIPLPELETSEGLPDVRIVYGKTPIEIPGAARRKRSYQVAPNHFLLRVPHVSRYSVTNGDCIVVEPEPDVEPETVRLFLLGTSFGALLVQRGILPIHGSAVVMNGKAVIFTGMSGAGKSTLLSAFRKRGALFLSDEIAAVTFDRNGVPWVQAGYPHQKLWRDTAEKMGMDVSIYRQIRSGIEKYAIELNESFHRKAAPLLAVFEVLPVKCLKVKVNRLTEFESLKVLIKNTYHPHLMNDPGVKTTHFQQCHALLRQTKVFRITRPEGVFSISEQADCVEQQLEETSRLSFQM
ncbi:MAG: hypothetical protein WC799_11645 [Desulfobacteraceae bacterium]|jgi:hypothetical protein